MLAFEENGTGAYASPALMPFGICRRDFEFASVIFFFPQIAFFEFAVNLRTGV